MFDFNRARISSTDFSKTTPLKNFMTVLPAGVKLFHTDRRTDKHDETNCPFLQIMRKAPQKSFSFSSSSSSLSRDSVWLRQSFEGEKHFILVPLDKGILIKTK